MLIVTCVIKKILTAPSIFNFLNETIVGQTIVNII